MIFSAAADGRNDGNFSPLGNAGCESAGVADILITNEDVDVFANLSLLGHDAIANPRVKRPQRGQRIAHSGGRVFELDFVAPSRELAQSSRNVKRYRHN
jgi:hypothetical protein